MKRAVCVATNYPIKIRNPRNQAPVVGDPPSLKERCAALRPGIPTFEVPDGAGASESRGMGLRGVAYVGIGVVPGFELRKCRHRRTGMSTWHQTFSFHS